MTNESEEICFNCDKRVKYDDSKGHLPSGWQFVRIEDKIYTLCESHALRFGPGVNYSLDDKAVSPRLREKIKNRRG